MKEPDKEGWLEIKQIFQRILLDLLDPVMYTVLFFAIFYIMTKVFL